MLRRLATYAPYLIVLIAFSARLIPGPRTIDDAFITFRYARNLLSGFGFVFNPDERVLGTTTPLYTLLLAGLAGLTHFEDYPWLALFVNALADSVTCVMIARLGEKLSGLRPVGLAAALLWAAGPMSVTFAVGGMETSLFILLLTLTADLYLESRTRAAALTAALLLLTRPDGALFVGALILDMLWRTWRTRRWPWVEAGIFLLTLAPWIIFATLYFGSPIPHSIVAKTLAYRLAPESALIRLIQQYGTPFFEHLVLGNRWPLAGFVLYLTLSTISSLSMFRRNSRSWPVALYPWIYFAAFAVANPLIFRWYLAPPLPFYFLLILTGLAKIGSDISTRQGKGERRTPPPFSPLTSSSVLLSASVFLVFSLTEWVLHPDHGPDRPAPDMAWHKLELLYQDVGQALAPLVTPQTIIAAGDVGALGYYSNARILDTVGLMSPQASTYYPLDPAMYATVYAVPPQLILDRQPDYLVLLEVYGREGLFKTAEFQAEYELLQKIPTDIYGSDGMLIWRRRNQGGLQIHRRMSKKALALAS